MRSNISQGEGAARVDELAARVRAGQLPPPVERARVRQAAGVTLEHFACVLGVSQMTVSRWERGETEPGLDQRIAYARLLREVAAATEEEQPSA